MGGEWASGAALVSESWPARASRQGARLHAERLGDRLRRGRAGQPASCSRATAGAAVFFVGILPALFTHVDPAARRGAGDLDRRRAHGEPPRRASRELSRPASRASTIALTLMNACTLFAWWGFNLWLPELPRRAGAQGGVGLGSCRDSLHLFVMQAGMWVGYVTFGFVSDRIRAQAHLRHLPAVGRGAAGRLRLGRERRRCC